MPPIDSPVLAIDNAVERFVWNQRVTTVVAGTSPHAVCPIEKTA